MARYVGAGSGRADAGSFIERYATATGYTPQPAGYGEADLLVVDDRLGIRLPAAGP